MSQKENIDTVNSISNSTFSKAMVELDGYNKWILDYYHTFLESPLLEIGVGHGAFFSYLPNHITTYTGLDIDKTLIHHAQSLYPNNQYICADLASDTFETSLNNQKFKSILCFNVLEHIEDHEKALRNMLSALSPRGHLLLFVPAFQVLYTDLDRLAGHYRRYKISDLIALASRCDGKIVKWSYFNFLGGIGWWVNRFMTHRSLNDSAVNRQIRFFGKVVLPLSKFIQPFTQKFFGQSLYVILKKERP